MIRTDPSYELTGQEEVEVQVFDWGSVEVDRTGDTGEPGILRYTCSLSGRHSGTGY